ncbi:epidermal differentiation-specific protein-like [Engystomops pustulosus]|uniref:epidermal differentiation-specific protein-like n=1 Tax=Engystomops pustulosus TaxID=76066 RepID=UPI003AFB0F37
MNTIELFEFPDFKGDSVSLSQDTADLSTEGFLQRAQSLKVQGDPWIVFSAVNYDYRGTFKCFSDGNHHSIPSWAKKISSARIVKGGLYEPKITLYEHINYGGKAVHLEKAATTLKGYGFDNMASSQKGVSGAWILYSEEYYKGDRMVTVAGEDLPNYHVRGWGDRVSSLMPIPPVEGSDA